ncbi:LRIQ3-like protein [Mya arenaria]|uniref:LRIQ3-like protein n=1 Tax=Mya arenaria TaxID=6604 RepID=A0ABY7GEJ6_MYAAR|nr:LRIQ3-like protein [Mya arenaria]
MVSIPDWTKFQRLNETQREGSNGLLITPSQDFLIRNCGKLSNGKYIKDVSQLLFVRLDGYHLRKIGDLTFCMNIRILVLNNNFLTKIDGLAACRHLIKLDLHSNQISQLPGLAFWSGMRALKFLHLHDNPLGKYESLQNLATCPNLMALTMFDTPLNEEIIEDAVFGGPFGAKNPNFRRSSFADELHLMKEIEWHINQIQAHFSPVLIVQKFMRGHLSRKKYGSVRQPKVKSARGTVPPPPSSSPVPDSIQREATMIHFTDRLQASPSPSEDTSYQRKEQTEAMTRNGSPRKRKNLLINLAKLETGTFSSIYDAEQIAIETVLPQDSSEKPESSAKRRLRKRKEKTPQRKIVKSVRQFFGPMVGSTPTPDIEDRQEDEEETPVTEYRLRGYKPNIILIDPTTEMILSKQEAGRFVRDAEFEHHKRLQDAATPRIKQPKKIVSNDQRIYSRAHGTMGMSCLFAVHQAYKDREKAEKTASKMEHILSMRDERDRAKERIKLYHDEKRSNALKQRDLERAKTLEHLEKREMQRLNYLDKRHEIKNKSADLNKSYRQDYTFITEFSNQHTSVSNALMRHDRQAKFEDHIQGKTDLVANMSAAEQEQKEVVKKYLEHRQLMRQTESAMARATLDTRMLTEVNDRMLEARTRVAQQKARRDTVQAFYPLPVMTPVPTASSAPANVVPGLPRWDTNILMTYARGSKHQTMVQ